MTWYEIKKLKNGGFIRRKISNMKAKRLMSRGIIAGQAVECSNIIRKDNEPF